MYQLSNMPLVGVGTISFKVLRYRIVNNTMGEEGIEPSPCHQDRFLRPARLPVSPLAHSIGFNNEIGTCLLIVLLIL